MPKQSMNSEFRCDPVSGEWVLIAPRRAAYHPRDFRFASPHRRRSPRAGCPFERAPESHEVLAMYGSADDWQVVVVKNRFPSLAEPRRRRTARLPAVSRLPTGPKLPATGRQYLVVTRDHDRAFADLSPRAAEQVFEAFRDTYRFLAEDPAAAYVSMFHNWGPTAGATVYHPHYQVFTLPIVPLHVMRSVGHAATYGRRTGRCIHCDLLTKERAAGERVIARSSGAIAVAPFAPRKRFEVRIFPVRHVSSLQEMNTRDLRAVSHMLQTVLRSVKRSLGDPDLNFYIHTAPIAAASGNHWYHWHIEVVPHLAMQGGFELATSIDVNPVPPELAAKVLRARKYLV